jgi:deazaflavin-dependent oxidoreductase (nitroreductase family)
VVKQYRTGWGQRFGNRVMTALAVRGRGPDALYVLSVPGRRSGVERSVPIDVLELDGQRYLVAPYGPVGWVHNVRAAGRVTLRRGADASSFQAVEVRAAEAVAPIREYIRTVPITKDYWEVGAEASDAEIAAIAAHHPVFRLA